MAIPEEIRKMRPTWLGKATEVRFIGGHYYVYEISSRWDENKRRPQKTTGRCIGKIVPEEGFIANQYYIDTYHQPGTESHVRHYGAVETLRQLGADIGEALRYSFPDIWRQIEVYALLRLVFSSTGKTMKYDYEHSWLSNVYPDIGVCDSSVKRMLEKLSMRQDAMEDFMRGFCRKGHKLIFDGTSIMCSTSDSYVTKGYNSRAQYHDQYRLLYVFDRTSRAPVFYRVLPGRMVDKAAFVETIRRCSCPDAIIIADKGFYSKANLSYLMEKKLRFILPLQENTTMIPPSFDEHDGDGRYDGRFTYKGRNIWYKVIPTGDRGNRIFIYQDDFRKAEYNSLFTERQEKEYGEVPLTDKDILSNRRRGVFSFVSNLEGNTKEVYLDYKERWEIENCFDYMKNSVVKKPLYAHDNETIDAQCFINHVALLYFYRLIRAMDDAGMKDEYSPDEVIRRGNNIYRISEYTGHKQLTEMTKEDAEIFRRLGVTLLA